MKIFPKYIMFYLHSDCYFSELAYKYIKNLKLNKIKFNTLYNNYSIFLKKNGYEYSVRYLMNQEEIDSGIDLNELLKKLNNDKINIDNIIFYICTKNDQRIEYIFTTRSNDDIFYGYCLDSIFKILTIEEYIIKEIIE